MADETRHVLNVFVASPRGVEKERATAQSVIDEANRILGQSRNVQLVFYGHENVLPGAGRAQARINRAVDGCHLFVGILWDRWGTPPGDQTYSAGFEEEFWRAVDRQKQYGQPEIHLFFKEVSREKLEDRDRHLRKVLRFKSKIERDHVCLYEVFRDGEWEGRFRDCLFRWVLESSPVASQIESERVPAGPSGPDPTGVRPPTTPDDKTEQAGRYPEQVTDLLRSLHENLGTRWPGEATPDQVARLYLLSKTWLSRHHIPCVLDTHEVNRYYVAREKLELAEDERYLLVRSAVADAYDARPGMYWLRGISDDDLALLLHYLAEADNEEVQTGALRLLGMADYEPPEGWADAVASDASSQVKEALLRFLQRREPAWGIGIAERLTRDPDVSVALEADRVHTLLLAAHDPGPALANAASGLVAPQEPTLSKLRSRVSDVPVAQLRGALAARNAETRLLAAEALAQRGQLTESEARQLAEDTSSRLAEVGLSFLLNLPCEPDEALLRVCQERAPSLLEEQEMRRLREMTTDQLLSLVKFYDVTGLRAYGVLALDHFDRMGDRLRADLEDGFGLLQAEHERELSQLLDSHSSGSPAAARASEVELSRQIESLRSRAEFLRATFTEAALAGLAQHGEEADARFARLALQQEWPYSVPAEQAVRLLGRFGNKDDAFSLIALADRKLGVRDVAVSAAADLLAKHGSPSDADRVVSLAKSHSGEQRAALASAAIRLAPGLDGAPGRLLESGEPTLVRLAFWALLGKWQGRRKGRAVQLLSSDHLATRDAAVSFLANVCDEDELRSILDQYVQQPTYYYSVVCALDRLLYAPGSLGESLRASIRDIVRAPKPAPLGRWSRRRSLLR